MVKKILLYLLCSLLGLIFIFSGLTKLYPVELFELTFIDIGIANWYTAPVLARLMIVMELFIGVLLLLNLKLKKFTLKASLLVLIIFTIYLAILWIVDGNQGNCKCFGNILVMTPLESIIKNLAMIALSIVLLIWHKGWDFKRSYILIIALALLSLTVPNILNPPDFLVSYRSQQENTGYKLELEILYDNPEVEQPSVDLRKGKHIIAFMSLSCKHCRVAAYKMYIISRQTPEIPFFLVLNGDETELKSFHDETKTNHIPYIILLGENFVRLAGYNMPAIFYVNQSFVEQKANYYTMNQEDILRWLSK